METSDEKKKQAFSDFFSTIGDIAEKTFDGLRDVATNVKDDLGRINFKEFISLTFDELQKNSSELFENLKNGFDDNFGQAYIEKELRDKIRVVHDFPKQGVDFQDISGLLASPDEFSLACISMIRNVDMSKIDYVVGIESRGFLFAAKIASMFDKGLVLIRKKGKLPPPVVSVSYSLEYGEDTIEMRPGIGNVLIVDDVLATGGTLKGSLHLCSVAGYRANAISVFLDMTHLHPADVFQDVELHSALKM